MQVVTIIFSAKIKNISIKNQIISLGGIYPDIEIENKNEDWLHLFKIKKHVPNHHSRMLNPVVKEASSQIEVFWTFFEHILKFPLNPLDDVYTQIENGPINLYGKTDALSFGTVSISIGLGENWFLQNKQEFFKKYNLDLLKRLNFAKRLADPIAKYLSLYSLVSSIASDNQNEIDRLIKSEDPTVQLTNSPFKKKGPEVLETTFTRLRNELAHHRKDASIFTTHEEIKLHIDRFECIVDSLISKKLIVEN